MTSPEHLNIEEEIFDFDKTERSGTEEESPPFLTETVAKHIKQFPQNSDTFREQKFQNNDTQQSGWRKKLTHFLFPHHHGNPYHEHHQNHDQNTHYQQFHSDKLNQIQSPNVGVQAFAPTSNQFENSRRVVRSISLSIEFPTHNHNSSISSNNDSNNNNHSSNNSNCKLPLFSSKKTHKRKTSGELLMETVSKSYDENFWNVDFLGYLDIPSLMSPPLWEILEDRLKVASFIWEAFVEHPRVKMIYVTDISSVNQDFDVIVIAGNVFGIEENNFPWRLLRAMLGTKYIERIRQEISEEYLGELPTNVPLILEVENHPSIHFLVYVSRFEGDNDIGAFKTFHLHWSIFSCISKLNRLTNGAIKKFVSVGTVDYVGYATACRQMFVAYHQWLLRSSNTNLSNRNDPIYQLQKKRQFSEKPWTISNSRLAFLKQVEAGKIKKRGFISMEELDLLSNVVSDPSPLYLISNRINPMGTLKEKISSFLNKENSFADGRNSTDISKTFNETTSINNHNNSNNANTNNNKHSDQLSLSTSSIHSLQDFSLFNSWDSLDFKHVNSPNSNNQNERKVVIANTEVNLFSEWENSKNGKNEHPTAIKQKQHKQQPIQFDSLSSSQQTTASLFGPHSLPEVSTLSRSEPSFESNGHGLLLRSGSGDLKPRKWVPTWIKLRKEAISTIIAYCFPQEFSVGFRSIIYRNLPLFKAIMNSVLNGENFCYREIHINELSEMKPIDQGGSSLIYRAVWKNKEVAVKKFIPRRDMMPEDVSQVKREICLLSMVQHPNLIVFHGACMSNEEIMIVIHLTKHGNLREFLKNRTLSNAMKTQISLDVAEGMKFLHSLDIVHRDLKSRNILIDEDNNGQICAKIIDFGTSRMLPTDQSKMTNAVGTVCWMSPEILKGENYSHKADIYSFAICCWEIFTGKEPFENLSPTVSIPVLVVNGERPSISEEIPVNIAKLIKQCWSQRSSKRPEFEEIVNHLRSFL